MQPNERLNIPLCVDLDGTFCLSDTFWESLIFLLRQNPLFFFACLFWLTKGKAYLKAQVAHRSPLKVDTLAINEPVLQFVKEHFEKGRTTVLATGANVKIAQEVADHFGYFSKVIASSDEHNNTAQQKRDALVKAFGEKTFDYMGNSKADVPVFEACDQAIVVRPDKDAAHWQKENISSLLGSKPSRLKSMIRAMRVHQWLKNTLVLVPLILAHEIGNAELWIATILAFFSFCFMSSTVYLFNDMFDLASDRQHPRKRNRPFASGALQIPEGLILAAVLLAASYVLAFMLPLTFAVTLTAYMIMTTLYSLVLKRKLLVDVFTLAGLFTCRVVAGTFAIGISHSYWLLAFSLFFFLSLAMMKRYSELWQEQRENVKTTAGRGYLTIDLDMIGQAGIAAAFASSLVLAFYIDRQAAFGLYDAPWLLWPLCPIILFMLLRLWVLTRRGFMKDDPLVFILQDWRSQFLCAVGGVFVVLAAIGI